MLNLSPTNDVIRGHWYRQIKIDLKFNQNCQKFIIYIEIEC